MKKDSALLILPGKLPRKEIVLPLLKRKERLLIAVDGGYDNLRDLDLLPEILIGDMDTISSTEGVPSSVEVIRLDTHKDITDLEAALILCKDRALTHVTLLGGTSGSRIDMIFNNIAVCAGYVLQGLDITILGDQRIDLLSAGRTALIHQGRFSVLSVFNNSEVRIKDAVYEFEGELSPASSRGISNEALKDHTSEITCLSGLIAVFSEID